MLAGAALATVTATAACGKPRLLDDTAVFQQRSGEVVTAWRAVTASPSYRQEVHSLDSFTVGPDLPIRDKSARTAFELGAYRLKTTPPTGKPESGAIRLPDGTALPAPLISAAEAFAAMRRTDPDTCAGCSSLTIDTIALGVTTLRTDRGRATVPAWLFHIDGTDVTVAQVAVAPSAFAALPANTPPARNAQNDQGRLREVLGAAFTGGDTLNMSVRVRASVCDKRVSVRVQELRDTVVFAGLANPARGPGCERTKVKDLPVVLVHPIDNKVVLDATTGQPFPTGQYKRG